MKSVRAKTNIYSQKHHNQNNNSFDSWCIK